MQFIKQISNILKRNLSQKTILCFLLFLCLSFKITAQKTFEFKHLQEKDGLSYNIVNCFLKDRNDFLWVGTFDGLNRFDGNHFLHFKKNKAGKNSILNNVIHDLAEDKDGDIWYSTRFGIGCFHVKTSQFENFQKVENQEIGLSFNIHCDRSDDIWFSVSEGLYFYSKKTKKFQFFKNEPSQNNTILEGIISKNGMVEDPIKRGLWLTSSTGLMYFDMASKQFFHYKNNPQNLPFFKKQHTSALSIDGKNQIVFGSGYNELSIVDVKSLKLIKQIKFSDKQVNKYNQFSTTFIDSGQNIWASTWVYRNFYIDGKTNEITYLAHSEEDKSTIVGDFIWCARQDEEGTMMLGTVNGISYTNPEKEFYKVHKISKKMPEVIYENDNINFFYEEDDGSWLFGTHLQGIFRYNPQTGKYKKYPISVKINIVKKFQNIYYLGCIEGLFTYNLKTRKLNQIKLPDLVEKGRKEILGIEIANDSTIWLANSAKYVMKYNTKTQKITPFDVIQDEKLSNKKKYLPQVFIDNKKEIWAIISNRGLLKFSEQKQTFLPIKNFKNKSFEESLLKPSIDKANNFWIPSSGNGLVKYDTKDNKFTLWSESEGLLSDLVHSNCIDNYGKIWVCAYNKISIYNPNTKNFQNFTIPISESNYEYTDQLNKLKNGHILLLMKGSLVEFLPEKIQNNALKNAPLINHLILTDTLIYASENAEIQLKVAQNSFNIIFGYLPLTQQNPYQFYYQLEGFNKNWVNNGNEVFANFSNLSGGDYVFKVKASNGNSESKTAQIKIHIATIFYKTWWFITVVTFSFLGLIYAFYRYRLNQSARFHQMQVITSSLEKDKTEIQYQNLINHLNPHFLFNSLTSLNSLITINPRQASNFLEKLSLIYRYILQNKEKEWITLEQELDFVQHYIDLQKSRFEDGLQINIDISENYFSKNIVPVTIQNLIENAIKHNIIDDETPLFIDIFVENNYLFVKNNLQKKHFVETSNKQGLESLRNLYKYLVSKPMETIETDDDFVVKVPLF